jgi:hypothetical protein
MKDSPYIYIIFAVLYWVSIRAVQNKNITIVGFAFLFVVNLIFTGYFGLTQIVNNYSDNDDVLINLGKVAIMTNCTFLITSLIFIIITINTINNDWKATKGASFELTPSEQKKMDELTQSISNNTYFGAIIIMFTVIFKTYFNNVNMFDKNKQNDISAYPEKIWNFIKNNSAIFFNCFKLSTQENYFTFKEMSMRLPYQFIVSNVVYIPFYIIAALISFVTCFFKITVPDIRNHFFRYVYVIGVPILSIAMIILSIEQLKITTSFLSLQRNELIRQ